MKNLVDHHNGCISEARLLELNHDCFIFPKNMAVSHEIQIGLIPWKSNACVEVSCTFDPGGAKNRDMFGAEKIGLVGTNPIDFILIIFVVRAH